MPPAKNSKLYLAPDRTLVWAKIRFLGRETNVSTGFTCSWFPSGAAGQPSLCRVGWELRGTENRSSRSLLRFRVRSLWFGGRFSRRRDRGGGGASFAERVFGDFTRDWGGGRAGRFVFGAQSSKIVAKTAFRRYLRFLTKLPTFGNRFVPSLNRRGLGRSCPNVCFAISHAFGAVGVRERSS